MLECPRLIRAKEFLGINKHAHNNRDAIANGSSPFYSTPDENGWKLATPTGVANNYLQNPTESAGYPSGLNYTTWVNQNTGEVHIDFLGSNFSSQDNSFALREEGASIRYVDDAIATYNTVRGFYPNSTITVSGHSLGGPAAQIVAAIKNIDGYIYNGVGGYETLAAAGGLQALDSGDNSRIVNIDNLVDGFLGASNWGTDIGSRYISQNLHFRSVEGGVFAGPPGIGWLVPHPPLPDPGPSLGHSLDAIDLNSIWPSLCNPGFKLKYKALLLDPKRRDQRTGCEGAFNTTLTYNSPLVLDLDGDGIETINVDQSFMYFDLNRDGFGERTGWAGLDDGVLALDLNNNGAIDNGGELFGNFTSLPSGQNAQHGFQSLAQYDTNGDGKITATDPIFNQLKVITGTTLLGDSFKSLTDLNIRHLQ